MAITKIGAAGAEIYDSTVRNVGAFTHPRNGTYFIWYDNATDRYGITRSEETRIHCGYATLAALFQAKGF